VPAPVQLAGQWLTVAQPWCGWQVYTQELPEGASQSDLLSMAATADAFELGSVSAACTASLAALPAAELELQTILWAYDLPDGITALDSSRQLQERAAEQLQQLLGDLEVTLQDAQKQRQLESLSYTALLALLRDPETRVAYESTAVAAVALWVAAKEAAGGTITLEQRWRLAGRIRMLQLPLTYLGTVLLKITWLQGVVTAQHIGLLAAAKGIESGGQKAVFEGMAFEVEHAVPARRARSTWRRWLAGPRPQSSRQQAQATVELSAAELRSNTLFVGHQLFRQAEPFVFAGYQFRVGACRERPLVTVRLQPVGVGGLPASGDVWSKFAEEDIAKRSDSIEGSGGDGSDQGSDSDGFQEGSCSDDSDESSDSDYIYEGSGSDSEYSYSEYESDSEDSDEGSGSHQGSGSDPGSGSGSDSGSESAGGEGTSDLDTICGAVLQCTVQCLVDEVVKSDCKWEGFLAAGNSAYVRIFERCYLYLFRYCTQRWEPYLHNGKLTVQLRIDKVL
jgi:hypothetical protein